MTSIPVRADSFTKQIPAKWSYFVHTEEDTNALNSVGGTTWGLDEDGNEQSGGITADPKMFSKLDGNLRPEFPKDITRINPGDYLKISVTGTVNGSNYTAAGVFVDRPIIRKRFGPTNRFNGVAFTMKVASLPDDFSGANAFWAGGSANNNIMQNTPNDFKIGRSDEPGIIVKVPTPPDSNETEIYFFHTVNANSFSGNSGSNQKIHFEEVDSDTGRPRFSLASTEINEGSRVIITRENAVDFPTAVFYEITTSGLSTSDYTGAKTGMLEFAGGILQRDIPFDILTDSIYESDESFSVRLYVQPNDNRNEAYIESGGATSHTYSLIAKNTTAKPNLIFDPKTITVQEGVDSHINVVIKSVNGVSTSFPVDFWLGRIDSAVNNHNPASAADITWPTGPQIHWPANQTTVTIPIPLKANDGFEGTETTTFHLGGSTHLTTSGASTSNPNGHLIATIIDGDSAPTLTYSGPNVIGEGDGTAQIVFSLPGAAILDVEIPLQISGTANLADYEVIPASKTITTGQTSVSLTIPIINDLRRETPETIIITLGSPTNATLGSPNQHIITILDNDESEDNVTVYPGGSQEGELPAFARPTANSAPTINALWPDPSSPDPSNPSLIAPPVAVWQIEGDPLWRVSGAGATGLAPARVVDKDGDNPSLEIGYHTIIFRDFDGYLTPPKIILAVAPDGSITVDSNSPGDFTTAIYQNISAPAPGGLKLTINTPAGTVVTPRWRLESDRLTDGTPVWRDSGTLTTNLPAGTHRVLLEQVDGLAGPTSRAVRIYSGDLLPTTPTSVSFTNDTNPREKPVAIGNSDLDASPHLFSGSIVASTGQGSGTAVEPNVVLTAGHLLFDDETLTFSTDVRWFPQRQQDHYIPGASRDSSESNDESDTPAAIYLMSGYAEERTQIALQENFQGAGISTAQSQNLDLGALIFRQKVLRGGRVGFLQSLPDASQWLTNSGQASDLRKTLVGYPTNGIAPEDLGLMHASAPSQSISFVNRSGQAQVYTSPDLIGADGMSGGGLFVEEIIGADPENNPLDKQWRLAAIYLGEQGADGLFHTLGEDEVALINSAQTAADDSGGSNGNDLENSGGEDDLFGGLFSARVVTIQTNISQGTWKTSKSGAAKASGETVTLVAPDFTTTIFFNGVPGYETPADLILDDEANGAVLTFNYVPLVEDNYESFAIALLNSSSNYSPSDLAAINDLDGDGASNFLEWASNLDLTTRDLQVVDPINGQRGLPNIIIEPTLNAQNERCITVHYICRSPESAPNLRYLPEFSENGTTWSSTGTETERAVIDETWHRVTFESWSPAQKRFARLRVWESGNE